MKLENQVVSLELAKKLKKLGFKQESYFYWADNEDGEWQLCLNWKNKEYDDPIIFVGRELEENEDGDYYPAYIVAELGEMLPGGYSSWNGYKDKWSCEPGDESFIVQGNIEADARAKMLVYLKKNNLIK